MKYKLIGLFTVALLLVCAFLAQDIEPEKNRYHQHLEALPKEACTTHGDELFCTHLPLMNITTDAPVPPAYVLDENGNHVFDETGHPIKNYETVPATIQYFDNEHFNNHLSDTPLIEERALFRPRGNSSRSFDKLGYHLNFKTEDLIKNLDISFSGMTADSEWALHGPFLDKTLIRNYMCYNLSGEIMDYAPNVRFCEMFLNGEYMGVYLIVEKIGFNENGRINVAKSDPGLTTTSYILVADRGAYESRYDLSTFGNYAQLTAPTNESHGQLEIIYPRSSLTEGQYNYIENDFSQFEKALFSFSYNDPDKGYTKYIDIDSFVDYFLINEFTLNYDALDLSTYLYKNLGEKLHMCVWDFNSAFDYYAITCVTPETFTLHNKLWYKYLFKDKAFVDKVIDRYFELREQYFNEEYLFAYIDATVEYLGPAIDRNFEKWGYSFNSTYEGKNYDYLKPAERNVRSYDEAISQLKTTISNRIIHMDNNLDRLYSLCHESMNKKYNYDTKGTLG